MDSWFRVTRSNLHSCVSPGNKDKMIKINSLVLDKDVLCFRYIAIMMCVNPIVSHNLELFILNKRLKQGGYFSRGDVLQIYTK